MRGTIFGGEIAWFVSHFYENSTPTGEGCESKKCMFAGNARAYTRKLGAQASTYFLYFLAKCTKARKHTKHAPNLPPKKLAKRAINLKELKKQNIETFFTPKSV